MLAAHANGELGRLPAGDLDCSLTRNQCQNPAQTAIKILHWQALGEVAEVIARLSEPLYRASEHRSPEMARACVVCLRETAKAAIASFNEIGGAL